VQLGFKPSSTELFDAIVTEHCLQSATRAIASFVHFNAAIAFINTSPQLHINNDNDSLLKLAIQTNNDEAIVSILQHPEYLEPQGNTENIISQIVLHYRGKDVLGMVFPTANTYQIIKAMYYAIEHNSVSFVADYIGKFQLAKSLRIYILRTCMHYNRKQIFQILLHFEQKQHATECLLRKTWKVALKVARLTEELMAILIPYLQEENTNYFHEIDLIQFQQTKLHGFDQSGVQLCGMLSFLKEHGIRLDSPRYILMAYYLTIAASPEHMPFFHYLIETYPLTFTPTKRETMHYQWLLFYCIRANKPQHFQMLVHAGLEPQPFDKKDLQAVHWQHFRHQSQFMPTGHFVHAPTYLPTSFFKDPECHLEPVCTYLEIEEESVYLIYNTENIPLPSENVTNADADIDTDTDTDDVDDNTVNYVQYDRGEEFVRNGSYQKSCRAMHVFLQKCGFLEKQQWVHFLDWLEEQATGKCCLHYFCINPPNCRLQTTFELAYPHLVVHPWTDRLVKETFFVLKDQKVFF